MCKFSLTTSECAGRQGIGHKQKKKMRKRSWKLQVREGGVKPSVKRWRE